MPVKNSRERIFLLAPEVGSWNRLVVDKDVIPSWLVVEAVVKVALMISLLCSRSVTEVSVLLLTSPSSMMIGLSSRIRCLGVLNPL